MIQSITLEYFRQHEKKSLYFHNGLNLIRGENEAGKSTILEAIAYALFGARVLDDSISDVVTWGFPESKLRVTLVLVHHGIEYNITRSKSSAEIKYEGKIVSGQKQTVEFIEELLGLPNGVAPLLLLAKQNSIRGAIEEGSLKVTTLVESLAGFNEIDELITLMEAKLELGNNKAREEEVDRFTAKMETLSQDYPIEPIDHTQRDQLEAAEAAKFAEIQQIKGQLDIASANLTELRMRNEKYNEMKERLNGLKTQLDQASQNLLICEKIPDDQTDSLTRIEKEIAEYTKLANANDAYIKWKTLPRANHHCNSTIEALKIEITDIQREHTELYGKEQSLVMKIGEKKKSLIHNLTCPTCKRDMPNAESAKKHNEAVNIEIVGIEEELSSIRRLKTANKDILDGMLESLKYQETITEKFINKHAEFVEVEKYTTPWILFVQEPERYDPQKLEALYQAQTDIKELQRLREEKLRKLANAKVYYELTSKQYQDELTKFDNLSCPRDPESLQLGVTILKDKINLADNERLEIVKAIQAERSRLMTVQSNNMNNQKSQDQIIADYDTAVTKLSDLNSNNQLYKAVKDGRRNVSDKLWNIILHSASHYFSLMRGVTSTVSKSSAGFLVDGSPSMSGSTKDILGLAIRFALMKTFLPAIDIIMLDEPAHGCDKGRTARMISLIATSDFLQQIVVTHADLDETVANNIIEW